MHYDHHHHLSGGAIAGIVVGVVIFCLILLAFFIYAFMRDCRRRPITGPGPVHGSPIIYGTEPLYPVISRPWMYRPWPGWRRLRHEGPPVYTYGGPSPAYPADSTAGRGAVPKPGADAQPAHVQ
ncbi:uncharacterized protein LAESUDRAFT_732140 [Laetiporus sulphureus 93-53]|uniref:Uncharacterized protein n=1 Tax=Laetiporus sulphureus 93-53 TaxID=1314785 RepID=A0A165B9J8_9APHY|nr:uncharacterized protein LAESUDRAFT_732140 [Laetiporus sulphureus 93-53]KZT00557.1 hypothetical protein LAESUDRAFT_732140 [Laetiporus sulphureus 93-53]